MYLKTLRFLANLLFKPIGLEFFPPAKRKRTPRRDLRCTHCGFPFPAFTLRQKVCKREGCIRARRKLLYAARRERRDFAQSQAILEHVKEGN